MHQWADSLCCATHWFDMGFCCCTPEVDPVTSPPCLLVSRRYTWAAACVSAGKRPCCLPGWFWILKGAPCANELIGPCLRKAYLQNHADNLLQHVISSNRSQLLLASTATSKLTACCCSACNSSTHGDTKRYSRAQVIYCSAALDEVNV